MKNHLLLNYLVDLSLVMHRKLKGESISNEPAIHRLVEGRTVSLQLVSALILNLYTAL